MDIIDWAYRPPLEVSLRARAEPADFAVSHVVQRMVDLHLPEIAPLLLGTVIPRTAFASKLRFLLQR